VALAASVDELAGEKGVAETDQVASGVESEVDGEVRGEEESGRRIEDEL
jgi:hypothetical protein